MGAETRTRAGGRPGTVVWLRGITKVYAAAAVQVRALDGVDLRVDRGEMVAIMGPSGSGKSTLMNIVGCLDRPTTGVYELAGRDVAHLSDDALADVRNRFVGFIFQNYNLLPRMTALENVELPLIYRGRGGHARREAAQEALAAVGLGERVRHLPSELSGGQQQRVAIARALVTQPEVLLADEPTGNLDSHSGTEIMALVQHLNHEGITVIMVSHDERIARHCRRIVRLSDGRVVGDEPVMDRLIAETAQVAGVGA